VIRENYDVVVLGAGSGGLSSAVGLAKVGKRVLLIEREHMGGECTNSGCIPSKALLHHAKQYYSGIAVAGKTASSETFRQEAFTYVRNKITELLNDETPEHFRNLGMTVVLGEGIFTSPKSIKVGQTEYFFKKAIVATGSQPRPLFVPGLAPERVLTNQNLFLLERIPEKILIVGGGPIGMEMGQALAMLGSLVTIVDNGPRFARLEDEAISPIITKVFTNLGITILNNAGVVKVENDLATIEVKNTEGQVNDFKMVTFDKVLVAIGRVPNIPAGIDMAHVTATTFGISVNKNWQSSNKHIYALGDVAAALKFTHVADDTARQVVAHIVSMGLLSVKEKAVPKVTYTEPEIAQVGLSWTEAKETIGEEYIMRVEVPLSANDRARTDDATEGLLVVVAKRLSGQILGAHLIAPRAGELLSTLTLAMENNISLYRLRSTIFAYPTYSLILKRAGDYFLAQQFKDLKPDLLRVVKRQGGKVLIALLWLWGLFTIYSYQQTLGLSASELSLQLFSFITSSPVAPLLYILLYTIRPITFFPGTALTILSGVFFGLSGIIYTIIGANLSSALAYAVGRLFSKNKTSKQTLFSSWSELLNKNPFLAILTMRLMFLPFDVVNYGAGLLRVSFVPYLLATFLGTLLGIVTFVTIGASISVQEFTKNGIATEAIDGTFIALSAAIFIASIIISKYLQKKK